MSHLCWWNNNAGAIQGICAILGVIGLGIYCWLTLNIRTAAIAQQKASQAPMLMFFKGNSAWAIRNYGVGPAVEINWKPGSINCESTDWYLLGALGPGDESDLPHHTRPYDGCLAKMPDDGALLHYRDSAGNYYATAGLWQDTAFVQNWLEIKGPDRLELK